MAKMPQDVQDLFSKVPDVVFSTACAAGQPNSCVVGMKKVVDDETVYVSDQFFKKTLANVKENDQVALVFWEGQQAYQIHGTARYVNEGEEFTSQKAWVDAIFEEKGLPIRSKGGVYVTVDAVYQVAAGPTAGDRLA